MTKGEILQLTFSLMAKHNLLEKGWSFKWNNRKRCWGLCSYAKKEIQLSQVMFVETVKYEDVKNTILHEIAHALTPGHKHGPVWRMKCREIGCSDDRTASYEGKPTFAYQWGIFYENKLVKGYLRRPSDKVFRSLPTMYLRSAPAETKGKLKIKQISA
jgi:hypothetical protein